MINLSRKWNKQTTICFVGLVIASIFLRVIFLSVTSYGTANDSEGYVLLAKQIARDDLAQDNGLRTPGYPLFLLIFGINPVIVRFAQMVLGVCSTITLFLLMWQITNNTITSVFVGAAYGLNISMISFENVLLTETLTTFLVVLSLVLFIHLLKKIERHQSITAWLLIVGGICSFTALVRPNFLILPLLLAAATLVKLVKESYRYRIFQTFLFLLPLILFIGGWSTFNYIRLGYWGPSTITGYSLTNISVRFIQYAPDQFAVIRDSYLDLEHHLGTNDFDSLGGGVVDQILNKTGWSYAQLSRELTKMSVYLFVHHPFLYIKSVFLGWISFWNTAGPITALSGKVIFTPVLKDPLLKIFLFWEHVERYGTILIFNFPFLLFVFVLSIQCLLKPKQKFFLINIPIVVMSALVILTSLTQALVNYSDSPRFAIPVRPLIVCVVLAEVWWMFTQNKLWVAFKPGLD